MHYDQKVFKAFRALAVTDANALIPGATYYSNGHAPFTFVRLATNQERYADLGLDAEHDAEELAWVKTSDGFLSLRDLNIGASYNPWLVFAHEGLSKACEDILTITFSDIDDPFLDVDWDVDGFADCEDLPQGPVT